nr:hypothetical protein 6 [Bacillaceae bacterium]
MKIQTITLKEFEVIEVNGQFEKRITNSMRYPACLTNKSLQLGKDLGLLQSSKIVSLLGFDEVDSNLIDQDKEQAAKEVLNDFDILRYVKVIYLSLIGFNKNLELTYEDFLEMYDESTEKTMDLFSKLIESYMSSDTSNNFAKGLQQSTKKKSKKGNRR